MSPPVRSGRKGGAENPLTFDPTWQRLTRTYVCRNLHAIRKNERRTHVRRIWSGTDKVLATAVGEEWASTVDETYDDGRDDDASAKDPFACEVRYYD